MLTKWRQRFGRLSFEGASGTHLVLPVSVVVNSSNKVCCTHAIFARQFLELNETLWNIPIWKLAFFFFTHFFFFQRRGIFSLPHPFFTLLMSFNKEALETISQWKVFRGPTFGKRLRHFFTRLSS